MKEMFKEYIETLEGEQLTAFTEVLDTVEEKYNETITNDYVSKEDYNKLALSYNKLNDDYKTRFIGSFNEHIEEDKEEPEDDTPEYTIENLFN